MEHITAFFLNNITSIVDSLGYPAVFVLMFLESVFVPIPSEITMPFAGFLVSQGRMNIWVVVIIGGFANLGGSLVGYWIGSLGEDKVRWLVKKYGKFVLVTIDEVELAEKFFREKGELIAFGSRLLPIVRTFISLPAGMAHMDIKKFSIYTLAGSLIWSYLLTYIGVALGNNWHSLEDYFRKFQFLIIGFFVLLFVWYVWHKVRKLRQQ